MITVEVPIKTPNPSNGSRGSHFAHARRVKAQRDAVTLCLKASREARGFSTLGLFGLFGRRPDDSRKPWVVVTLTRVSPGKLDEHDNLRSALKGVADSVAAYFGVPDNDPRLVWKYAQVRGKAAVRIAFDVEVAT